MRSRARARSRLGKPYKGKTPIQRPRHPGGGRVVVVMPAKSRARSRQKDAHAEANRLLRENNVVWVQCQFVDINGRLRSYSVPAEDFIEGGVWDSGMSFDGSSVGFRRAEDSDLLSRPDPETLRVLPYGEGAHKIARVIVDIEHPRGRTPFAMDPRDVARRADGLVRATGFDRIWVQPELEFYLLKSRETLAREQDVKRAIAGGLSVASDGAPQSPSADPLLISDYSIEPKSGYFAAVPIDVTDAFRNEFSYQLGLMGIPIKYHHHEGGGKQVEIEFKHLPSVMGAADAAVLYKFMSRIVASRYGFVPTYMPKPLPQDAGNGMHIHQWIEHGGKAVFYDKDDEYGLSQTARYYIGGVIDHARAMTAVTNPTVNSYKRLVPEFEAPVYVAWSPRNRTALIRIPSPFRKKRTGDFEVRHPDPAANPYLAFAVVVTAGLDGIRRKLDPGDPINEDVTKMSKRRMRELNVTRLPVTLDEALDAMESDDVVREALGDELFYAFIDMKAKELAEHSMQVSSWEIERYFDI